MESSDTLLAPRIIMAATGTVTLRLDLSLCKHDCFWIPVDWKTWRDSQLCMKMSIHMTPYLSWRVILPLRNYPQVPFPWLNTKLQANLILRRLLPPKRISCIYIHLWINQTQEMQPSHDNIALCANKNSCIVSVAPRVCSETLVCSRENKGDRCGEWVAWSIELSRFP